MENARIFYTDDNEPMRNAMGRILGAEGHQIVLFAGTVAQSLKLIPEKLIEREVQVAVVDRNLPDGSGEEVAEAIRKSNLAIAIISFSSEPGLRWGDINVDKSNVLDLIEAIKAIPSTD